MDECFTHAWALGVLLPHLAEDYMGQGLLRRTVLEAVAGDEHEREETGVACFLIFNKWSLDPQRRCMLPERPDKRLKRNDACWHGFWLDDSEVDRIVNQVVGSYEAARDAARRSTA